MKSLPRLLLCAAVLAMSHATWALPEETLFRIALPNGPDPLSSTDVGTIYFELDADLQSACRYYAVWSSASDKPIEVDCYVNESTTFGHASCAGNGRTSFVTMIDMNPQFPCSGFDVFAQARRLFLLTGAESASPGIDGLIQWTAASPLVWPFEARRYP